jgi:AsmA protein
MGRLFKLIAILALLVLGLVIGLVIFLKSILTPDLVRQKVLPVVSEQIGRPITVGDIDIGLFSGITLRDVAIGAKVSEKASESIERGALISAREASLGYDLMPLLSGRIVINHLSLKGPELTIVRRQDGSLNISELLGGQKAKGQPSGHEAPKGPIPNPCH